MLNGVPYPEIGSLEDVTHHAAFFMPQTYLDPRVQVNFAAAPYNAVCNGVADDTTAFLAFKAAWQGTTPVQLNLPAGTCTFTQAGGGSNPNFYTFKGIANLVVNGQGTASTTFKSLTGSLSLGGSGQFQDNAHSVRTNDANAGDSCVILKTAPAVTISAIANNLPYTSVFQASVSGTTMTVSSVTSGTIAAGAYISGANNAVGLTAIQPYGTGGTTGVGGTGTYSLTANLGSLSSQVMRTLPATFTATSDATGILSVSAMKDGTIATGAFIYRNGGGSGGQIKSQLTGTGGAPCPDATCNGGVGTYQLSHAATAQPTPADFVANGQVRVTLNSTTGLTSGDTLYLTGMIGTGVLPQRVNGLQWIKVINGTQIDLFQQDFNGGYTSGGTGGGDRTSLFPIGAKVLMTGWTNQAYWGQAYGYPSNPQWFEYKTVTTNNSGTHQVCFDTALTNSYKSTWPQYNTGSQFEVDAGGPATLYVLDPTWEMTAVFQNFTLDSTAQVYANGRSMAFSNVAMTGGLCVTPTQNETHTWANVSAPNCNIETDKIIGTWDMSNSSVHNMHIQSSSMLNMNVNTVTASSWAGTTKNFAATNLTITGSGLQVGTANYGASSESSCINCTMVTGISRSTPVTRVDYPGYVWSMSGGVITVPNAWSFDPSAGAQNPGGEIQTRGLVPGSYNFWSGAGGGGASTQTGRAFKVVDVTQDLDNTYIQTSEAGGFPTGAWTTNGLSIFPHPAPKLTTVSISGDYTATAFNGCPAQGPYLSCQNYVFTGSATGTTPSIFPVIWGELDTFTFTNNVPYTGAGALTWNLSQFSQMPYLKTDNTQVLLNEAINVKLPSSCGSCTRTLTTSGATNTQVGDSFTTPPAGAVFGGGTSPNFSANTPSDSPQVTVTLRTNQHLP